jgi:hypothetical protein
MERAKLVWREAAGMESKVPEFVARLSAVSFEPTLSAAEFAASAKAAFTESASVKSATATVESPAPKAATTAIESAAAEAAATAIKSFPAKPATAVETAATKSAATEASSAVKAAKSAAVGW